jgi:hypothetical protein
MRKRRLFAVLGMLLLLAAVAAAQGNPAIDRFIIGGGGHVPATGGNVSLGSALGQAVAGRSSSGNVLVMSGLWAGGGASQGWRGIHLPLTVRGWPPLPGTPELQTIANPDGIGDYTVRWSSVSGAEGYTLQEAKDSAFASATQEYDGSGTSYNVVGRGAARYFYRVQARNKWGGSLWSDPQSVDVLWEAEPNDSLAQANGPLVSALTYHGFFSAASDPWDYYYFELASAHNIQIQLSQIPAGHDYALYLFDASKARIGYSDEYENADERILVANAGAGRYYAGIERVLGSSAVQPYSVQVVFQP